MTKALVYGTFRNPDRMNTTCTRALVLTNENLELRRTRSLNSLLEDMLLVEDCIGIALITIVTHDHQFLVYNASNDSGEHLAIRDPRSIPNSLRVKKWRLHKPDPEKKRQDPWIEIPGTELLNKFLAPEAPEPPVVPPFIYTVPEAKA